MILAEQPAFASLRLRDHGRLHLALAVSVVLHLIAGNLLAGLRFDNWPQGDSALYVSFRPVPAVAPETQRKQPLRDELAVEQIAILITRPPAPLRPTVAASSRAARVRDELQIVPAAAVPGLQPDPGPMAEPLVEQVGKPGVVKVVLLINERYHAEQIFWDKLPAINDQQLRRLEAHLRSRVYQGRSGQAIAESLDVVAFLRSAAAGDGTSSETR